MISANKLRIYNWDQFILFMRESAHMDDNPEAKSKRAIHFADQVKASLNSEFGSKIDWEGDSAPNLKFVIKTSKNYEMKLEYNATDDSFLLYDRDAKTQRNETLGNFSPVNTTNPNDSTPSEIVNAVKSYAI